MSEETAAGCGCLVIVLLGILAIPTLVGLTWLAILLAQKVA